MWEADKVYSNISSQLNFLVGYSHWTGECLDIWNLWIIKTVRQADWIFHVTVLQVNPSNANAEQMFNTINDIHEGQWLECCLWLPHSNLPIIYAWTERYTDFQAGHMALMDLTGDINNLHESPIIEICVNERCPTKFYYSAAK